MRRFWIVAAVLVVCLAALAFTSQAVKTSVQGDYVEVRTASVFAGACHFNGEVVTTGRDALMAWNVTSGSWNATDLTGMRAIAIVNSEENLANAKAARRSELILDQSASHDQKVAMLNALKSRYASALGDIISVRSAPITFKHEGKTYDVSASGAAINVEAMPNDLCCRMPNLVWYDPLVALGQRKVGYTIKALYGGHNTNRSLAKGDREHAVHCASPF